MSQFKIGDEVLIKDQKVVGRIRRLRKRTLIDGTQIDTPVTYVVFLEPHTEQYCTEEQLVRAGEIDRLLYL